MIEKWLAYAPSIRELIRELVPFGTRPERAERDWSLVPWWPPDVFAVAAALLDRSGCYAFPFPRLECRPPFRYSACEHDSGTEQEPAILTHQERAELMRVYGARWRDQEPTAALEVRLRPSVRQAFAAVDFAATMHRLQSHWTLLISSELSLAELCEKEHAEERAALLELMWIADEASVGIGKLTRSSSRFAARYARRRSGPAGAEVLGQTACELVPVARLCVQPKMRTPQVGCTIRSMSHHLALLPAATEVRTVWSAYPAVAGRDRHVTNVLLIPYPFSIRGRTIVPGENVGWTSSRWFNLEQHWLRDDGRGSLPKIEDLVSDLVANAEAEVGDKVHGVVLPEGALDPATASAIAAALRSTDVEFFITGVSYCSERGRSINRAAGWMYWGSGPERSTREWSQDKHHRWKLDASQIRRYQLGHALSPSHAWWENIEIGSRTVELQGSAGGGALAALICEDLARIDPVQTILRSVGPNLVFALLMDGPQLTGRWSARYATVLADDPGSSVITLTSAGMVKRSHAPGEPARLCIGLWKDSTGMTQELVLPPDAHGLLLSLARHKVEQVTLDGRCDGKATTQHTLSGIHAIQWCAGMRRAAHAPSAEPAHALEGAQLEGGTTDYDAYLEQVDHALDAWLNTQSMAAPSSPASEEVAREPLPRPSKVS